MRKIVTVLLFMIVMFVNAQSTGQSLIGTWFSNYDGDYGEFEIKANGKCVLAWYRMPGKVLFDKAEGSYTIKNGMLSVRWTKSYTHKADEFEPWSESGRITIKNSTFRWEGGSEVWTRKK